MPSEKPDVADNKMWCFRAETAKLLGLSITQIHTSLTDGETSVGTLTDSFSQLAEFCGEVQRLASGDFDDKAKERVQALAASMFDSIDKAIVAFQFYDRLSQRMDHVSTSLDQLSNLIKDDDHLHDPKGWQSLREHIRSSYSMAAEHAMYEAIMNGATVQEALSLYKEKMRESDASEDIELF